MAPMAGVSSAAWRIMARRYGAALAYTEMVSCSGVIHDNERSWGYVDPDEEEPDIAVQLFGHEPALFREVAARVADRLGQKLVLIDINMACPVPKVTKNGEGSALLDYPELAAELVSATIEGVDGSVPVTVKIRRGRRIGEETAPEFARSMADAGAAAIAVHGRFATQLYRGEADWGCVSRVRDAVDVPVIGSGDVLDAASAVRMLRETGADGVMIARGSYGNPWIFEDARALMRGEEPPIRSLDERLDAFEEHLHLMDRTGAHMIQARSICGWYFKGLPHASALRDRAMQCVSAEDFLALVSNVRELLAERGVAEESACS
ncbi:MAG: tRNA dihydrouridine synthase DusB [Atopobiaceae bacterium]|nr:tRNA dihydrouridine synthase DusB [Atopobiaceae bacterium]